MVQSGFGTSHRRLVHAVGTYLQETTAALDLASLEVVAAAAPFLGPDRAANVVEQLPRTRFDLCVRPTDLRAARAAFSAAFGMAQGPSTGAYSLATREKLVRSLLSSATIQALELAPAASLPDPARSLLRAELERRLRKGGIDDVGGVLHSRLVDRELFLLARDRVLKAAGRNGGQDRSRALDTLALSMPEDLPEDLVRELLQGRSTKTLKGLARRRGGPPLVLEILADDSDEEIRASVAANPTAPRAILMALSRDRRPDVRAAVAANPASPPALLGTMGNDEPTVLRGLAAAPGVPAHVLVPLLHHPDAEVRTAAAANSSLPLRELVAASTSQDPAGRSGAASNIGLPPKFVALLAGDANCGVRARIARRDDLPIALADALSHDSEPEVRDAVLYSSATPSDRLLATKRSHHASRVAMSRRTPAVVLIELTSHPDPYVRKSVARNPRVLDGDVALPDGAWERICDELDPHEAFRIAARGQLGSTLLGVEHPSATALRATATALRQLVRLPPERGLRSWQQLPSRNDSAIELPIDASVIESVPLVGPRGHVARTGRELERAGQRMGNCLSKYADRAYKGEVVIATYDDAERNEVIAACWEARWDGTWQLAEVNSLHNQENLPSGFKDAARALEHSFCTAMASAEAAHAGPGASSSIEAPAPQRSDGAGASAIATTRRRAARRRAAAPVEPAATPTAIGSSSPADPARVARRAATGAMRAASRLLGW